MKKGFTLIELLVVVLIIGILAAVALPRYNAAVEKSRAAEAFSILRSVSQAQDRYRLLNDAPPQSFDDIDLVIPGTVSSGTVESRTTQYFQYRIFPNTGYTDNVYAYRQHLGYSYVFIRNPGGTFGCCWNTEQYKTVCASLGFNGAYDKGLPGNFSYCAAYK